MRTTRFLFLVICTLFPVTGCKTHSSSAEHSSPTQLEENNLYLAVGQHDFSLRLANNETATALMDLLPLQLNMQAMEHEKYFFFDRQFPVSSYQPIDLAAGDVMLYGSNCLVIFYEDFTTSYSYTRIGWIDEPLALATALGTGPIKIELTKEVRSNAR